MTADDIRKEPITRDTGPYVDDSTPAIAFFLREIAAQLAELNASISVPIDRTKGELNVFVTGGNVDTH